MASAGGHRRRRERASVRRRRRRVARRVARAGQRRVDPEGALEIAGERHHGRSRVQLEGPVPELFPGVEPGLVHSHELVLQRRRAGRELHAPGPDVSLRPLEPEPILGLPRAEHIRVTDDAHLQAVRLLGVHAEKQDRAPARAHGVHERRECGVRDRIVPASALGASLARRHSPPRETGKMVTRHVRAPPRTRATPPGVDARGRADPDKHATRRRHPSRIRACRASQYDSAHSASCPTP